MFKRSFKKYHKKYKSIKSTIFNFSNELIKKGLDSLTNMIDLGESYYKIRIACPERNKGKSGGYRIAFIYEQEKDTIILLALWMHPDVKNIDKNRLKSIYEQFQKMSKTNL